MIITLKGANFSASNIGTLDSWFISWSGSGLTPATGNVSSIKKDNTTGATLTYTYNTENYEYVSGTVKDATGATVGNVSASNGTVTVTINAGNTINGKITIAISMNYIGVGEEPEPENPVNPPSSDTNTVTWEMGAIDSGNGPNSTNLPTARIRTTNYLQVNGSITISCSGNAEFCPIYYHSDKKYISSPNAYQTTPCIVDASSYPLVRIMARDKTNTSSCTIALGDSITITGSFTEIPYDDSGSSDSGTTPETPAKQIPPLADTATWYVGALNSSGGEIVSMSTRLYSNRFALTSSPMTVTVSGDAEICPVWYKEDGSFKSSPSQYQTTAITTTSTDGYSVAFMIRNKNNVNATLTSAFGSNVTIAK